MKPAMTPLILSLYLEKTHLFRAGVYANGKLQRHEIPRVVNTDVPFVKNDATLFLLVVPTVVGILSLPNIRKVECLICCLREV